MLPSIYISHGSPALTIMDNASKKFLQTLAQKFDTPKYILVISAHWTTKELRILNTQDPSLIYDFYNFPPELYQQTYSAKNDLDKVNEVIELLNGENIKVIKENQREGYDHGVWSPLKLVYPKADIPIIQLSLPQNYSAFNLLKLGEALQSLRDDTLIVSSGAMTHNLRGVNWHNENAEPINSATEFRNWIVKNTQEGNVDSLLDFKTKAPSLQLNHPTLEHFMPFFVPLGASKNRIGQSLHNVYMYGNQSMDTIIFKD